MPRMGTYRIGMVSIAGFAALLAALLFTLFGMRQEFNGAVVEKHLAQFGEFAAAEAKKHGMEAHFSHGAVMLGGLAYDKHAELRDVRMEILGKKPGDTRRWVMTTPSARVEADRVLAGRLHVFFSEPITIENAAAQRAVLQFSEPLEYVYYDANELDPPMQEHVVRLPKTIAVERAQGNVVIKNDGSAIARLRYWPQTKHGEAGFSLKRMQATEADGRVTTLAALNAYLNEKPGSGGNMLGQASLTFTDLAWRAATNPYSLTLDAEYAYPLQAARGAHIMLNTFALMNATFKIKASGDMAFAADDPLPSGQLQLDIANAGLMLASDLVPVHLRTVLKKALERAADMPIEQTSAVSLPLKREKKGTLFIGNITFDELAADLLSSLLKNPPSEEKNHEQ